MAITGIITCGLVCAGLPPRVEIIVMVVCLTYGSYAIDRIVDERDAGRRPTASLLGSGIAAGLVSLGIATLLAGFGVALIACVFPLAVAAYCMPWLAPLLGHRGIRRAKDLPWTKNLYTAAFVAGSGVWAAHVSGVVGANAMWMLGGVGLVSFAKEFVNTAASDLADIEEDRRRGVPTLVVRWGRRATIDRLMLIAAATALGLGMGALAGWLVPAAGFVAVGGLLVLGYLVVLRGPCSYGVAKLAPDLCNASLGGLALLGWALTS